jgi:hypothetical protein
VRRLRDTEPELRRAIVALNRRTLLADEKDALVRGGEESVTLLSRLATDHEVAELPRTQAIGLLGSLQFTGSSQEDLDRRDHGRFISLMKHLLTDSRPAIRAVASIQLVRFLRVGELLGPRFQVDRGAITRALRETVDRGGLPVATDEFLKSWLDREARQYGV